MLGEVRFDTDDGEFKVEYTITNFADREWMIDGCYCMVDGRWWSIPTTTDLENLLASHLLSLTNLDWDDMFTEACDEASEPDFDAMMEGK